MTRRAKAFMGNLSELKYYRTQMETFKARLTPSGETIA